MCVKREKAQLLFYIEELFKERDVNVMRKEHDFLGEMEIPEDVYYGVQTMRAIENFRITGQTIDKDFVQSMAKVKKAARMAA